MKKGTIPTGLMQQIVNYLEERPFKEVTGLLDAILKNFQPLEEEEKTEVTPEEKANGEIRAGA